MPGSRRWGMPREPLKPRAWMPSQAPHSAVLDFCLQTLVSGDGAWLCPAGPYDGILRGDEPRSCASDSLMVTAVAWGALLTQAETICRGSPMVRILTVAKWPSSGPRSGSRFWV
ncbi:hypothetical protein CI102_13540 [Trichoderma harzianum]|uniref:Uncharacterized protein n=1 Tax=Trichoderma harzianum CBS 226.95 TaxID=983964 RepID=A0A2T4AF36_TRIHA|nr:hypothetical protein M431DRAFT_403282 [Trichoderma harzianum CBS 226.95]PKK43519.1 hypothetical protein CI102_13540 [Trichoderma harzianum]PTB55538.1 hypothetical protein M431DRAFT_403282 [Trichoderma harzianum CBS 226.95]